MLDDLNLNKKQMTELFGLIDEWFLKGRQPEIKDKIMLIYLDNGADADILKILNAILETPTIDFLEYISGEKNNEEE